MRPSTFPLNHPLRHFLLLLAITIPTFLFAQTPNESILDIDFQNPDPAQANLQAYPGTAWTANVCGTSIWLPGSTPKEWVSILDDKNYPDNNQVVGVAGIALNPHTSDRDVWFTHPFGFDYNFDVAWHSNPNFDVLASPRIKEDADADDAWEKATNAGFQGVMHVEMDSAFVPPMYRASEGSSVGVFGRWVVDCGHDNYQTEIHPPLMMVKANGQPLSEGGSYTESTVISRPFLVAQTFGNNQSLRNQIAQETNELLQSQLSGPFVALYEYKAFPHILPNSFSGLHWMSFNIRPPREGLPNEHLFISYHLTIRTGVTVTFNDVIDGKGTIRVNVLMDESSYIPPALPPAEEYNVPIETAKEYNDDLNIALWVGQFGTAANPFVSIALEKGVKTNRYTIPVYPEQSDVRLTMNELRANDQTGITVDNDQVYPIRGSIKVEWVYIEPEPIKDICVIHPSPLTFSVNEIDFFPSNADKSQLVTIHNPTSEPIQLGKLFLDGTNPDKFVLENKSIILLRRGMSQPAEDCSNTILPPNGSCSFRVKLIPTPGSLSNAILNVPGGGPCNMKIQIREVGSY